MRYEVRVDGSSLGVFATAEEALDCVRRALEQNPNHEPEIIDMTTGKAYEPAASVDERDELADKIGY